MICLDIGTDRNNAKPGYISVDLYDDAELKVPMDALGLHDNTVSAIHCSHALEHVSRHEVAGVLEEWRRVLGPGGTLTLEVPDLAWVCAHLLIEGPGVQALDFLFGLQTSAGQCHKTGFTDQSLWAALARAGFGNCEVQKVWSHDQQCLRVEVVLP